MGEAAPRAAISTVRIANGATMDIDNTFSRLERPPFLGGTLVAKPAPSSAGGHVPTLSALVDAKLKYI
jgi:hypothetical protein